MSYQHTATKIYTPHWKGKADANGYVVIPTGILQQVTTITTPSHKDGKDLIRDSEKDADGAWVVELYPNHVSDSSELGVRPFKLVDARSNRPLANASARIAFGETESLEVKNKLTRLPLHPFRESTASAGKHLGCCTRLPED